MNVDVTDVHLGVLGPLLVRSCGHDRQVSSAKQRDVLATLLVRANEIVPVEQLTDIVWDGRPPPTAPATVRNYIKRLRHTLGPDAGARILTQAPGYVIHLESHELDRLAFAAMCRDGEAAIRSGAWTQASDTLTGALRLWRGAALVDVASQSLRREEVPRLDRQRLQAIEWRIDADLALGRHAPLIGELRPLTGAHPLRERFHAQLIVALARCGRRGEALEAYQLARRAIVDELGVEPGPELQDLQRRVLTADVELAGDQRDGVLQSVHLTAAVAPEPPPRQLPALTRQFVGRHTELAQLDNAIESDRNGGAVAIVAIDGMAGCGKTSLAVHWAHRVADRFPDGQLFADLRGFDPEGTPAAADEIVQGFLSALGATRDRTPAQPVERAALYRSLTSGRRILVILDNARDWAQVKSLLPGSSSCAVVVTSRSRLVGLIAAEGAVPVPLDTLGAADAQQVLARYAGPERVAAEPKAAADLVADCGGLPLALAIVGAWASTHPAAPLAELSTQLHAGAGVLHQLDAGDDTTSVRAVLSWSFRALGDSAAHMLRLIALAPGPDLSLAAAASLAGARLDDARLLLAELTGANLVMQRRHDRFGLHDLVRAYALDQASTRETPARRRAALRRLFDYYVHSGHAAALALQPGRQTLELRPPLRGVTLPQFSGNDLAHVWFDSERHMLRALTAAAAAAGEDRIVWQLATILTPFLDRGGHWIDCHESECAGLHAAIRLGDLFAEAHCHHNLGQVLTRQGKTEEGMDHVRTAIDLYRRVPSIMGEARAHVSLALQYGLIRRTGEARKHASRAEVLFAEIGHGNGQANALNSLGWLYAKEGRHGPALVHCRRALDIYVELGNRPGQAATWDSLGFGHHVAGDYSEAIACFHRALVMLSEVGDRLHYVHTQVHLAESYAASGDDTAARQVWRAALPLLDEIGDPLTGEVRRRLADCHATG